MQDSENKNPLNEGKDTVTRRVRHAAAESEIKKPVEETDVSDEDEILVDEGDIPLRRSKKKPAAKSKGKKYTIPPAMAGQAGMFEATYDDTFDDEPFDDTDGSGY